jgi:hypothetical protein
MSDEETLLAEVNDSIFVLTLNPSGKAQCHVSPHARDVR